MCLTVAEADKMIEAADRNEVIVMCGQSRRFNDPLMAAHEMLQEGKIGKLINNFAAEIKEFATAIRENRQPMASGREIRPVIAVMEAIIKSAVTHEVVEI